MHEKCGVFRGVCSLLTHNFIPKSLGECDDWFCPLVTWEEVLNGLSTSAGTWGLVLVALTDVGRPALKCGWHFLEAAQIKGHRVGKGEALLFHFWPWLLC